MKKVLYLNIEKKSFAGILKYLKKTTGEKNDGEKVIIQKLENAEKVKENYRDENDELTENVTEIILEFPREMDPYNFEKLILPEIKESLDNEAGEPLDYDFVVHDNLKNGIKNLHAHILVYDKKLSKRPQKTISKRVQRINWKTESELRKGQVDKNTKEDGSMPVQYIVLEPGSIKIDRKKIYASKEIFEEIENDETLTLKQKNEKIKKYVVDNCTADEYIEKNVHLLNTKTKGGLYKRVEKLQERLTIKYNELGYDNYITKKQKREQCYVLDKAFISGKNKDLKRKVKKLYETIKRIPETPGNDGESLLKRCAGVIKGKTKDREMIEMKFKHFKNRWNTLIESGYTPSDDEYKFINETINDKTSGDWFSLAEMDIFESVCDEAEAKNNYNRNTKILFERYDIDTDPETFLMKRFGEVLYNTDDDIVTTPIIDLETCDEKDFNDVLAAGEILLKKKNADTKETKDIEIEKPKKKKKERGM